MALRLLAATTSQGKLRDFRTAARAHSISIDPLPAISAAPAPEENGANFIANATLKAIYYSQFAPGMMVLADDSGLEVDALHGAPGVHSARFAALDEGADSGSTNPSNNSPDAENNAKLLRCLQNVALEKRTGRFHCVIALVPVPEARPESASPVCYADEFAAQIFDGACEGRIQFAPSGRGGFGYDPLFVPVGYQQSFAELGEDVKNQLSHRAKALAKLKAFFKH
jgi:XTP/dITP diphosphohydrolase